MLPKKNSCYVMIDILKRDPDSNVIQALLKQEGTMKVSCSKKCLLWNVTQKKEGDRKKRECDLLNYGPRWRIQYHIFNIIHSSLPTSLYF